MVKLQTVGVAAGAVLDSKDLLFNPHLLARGFFEVVSHHPSTGIPPLPYVGRPWKMSLTPPLFIAVNSDEQWQAFCGGDRPA